MQKANLVYKNTKFLPLDFRGNLFNSVYLLPSRVSVCNITSAVLIEVTKKNAPSTRTHPKAHNYKTNSLFSLMDLKASLWPGIAFSTEAE